MRVAGIIAEYNPFHNGHRHHMQAAKKASGATYVAVVLSGEFVQRGEPAVVSKDLRTAWALEHGADIVFELPVTLSLGSAMSFARGGVGILHAAGFVTHLCFGSETEDVQALSLALLQKQNESAEFRMALREGLRLGMSFPRAQHFAYEQTGAPGEVLSIFANPNTILALEYLCALFDLESPMIPVPILRKDAGHHDEQLGQSIASASAIRKGLFAGDERAYSSLPPRVAQVLRSQKKLIGFCDLGEILPFELSRHSKESLCGFEDVSEGFENLLLRALNASSCTEDLLLALKSKRYTMARIKRILCRIVLGIDNELSQLGPQYIRVLGMRRESGPCLLQAIRETASLPVVVTGQDLESLSPKGRAQFAATERAARVISILSKQPHIPQGSRRLIVI